MGRRSGRAAAKRAAAALGKIEFPENEIHSLDNSPRASRPRVAITTAASSSHSADALDSSASRKPASGAASTKIVLKRSHNGVGKLTVSSTESTPKTFEGLDDEDEVMPDVEPESEPAREPEEEEEEEEEKEESAGEEDAGEEEEEEEEEESAKSPTPAPEPVIRRRRLGRPPKNRPPDWDTLPIERPEDRDPNATPRRRGRGGWRGRGGRKGQHFTPTTQSIDKDGNTLPIIDDEVELPEDAEGETKVDKNGNLQGGRKYRCRTFKVIGRGDRLYMLSTEPARCVGFRDSYLFFTKHKKLYKIIIDDDEKRDLIERELIPHSYKGRTIGIVTARSVFREFGAVIVVGGRRIADDYEVARAREEGAVEGEIADPTDSFDPEKEYNVNQYVAWHGASAVYHSASTVQPAQTESFGIVKKRRVAVNDTNWQLEHAREARYVCPSTLPFLPPVRIIDHRF